MNLVCDYIIKESDFGNSINFVHFDFLVFPAYQKFFSFEQSWKQM